MHRMVVNAVEMEGTVTGEHGVGLIKRDYLPHELGETTVDVMRKVSNFSFHLFPSWGLKVLTCPKLKFALDPLCLLNCDKTVRVEPPAAGEIKPW